MTRWLDQIRQYPLNFGKTIVLYTSLISLGMNAGVKGPVLLDLRTQVNHTLAEVSTIMPLGAGGYAIGSFAMGFMFNRVNILLYGAICMAITACLVALIPHILMLQWLQVLSFFSGLFLGGFESGSNVFLLHLWGRENGPFMQAFDFSYGVGTLLATLIARPFLLETDENMDAGIEQNGTMITTTSTREYTAADLMLLYPFSIIAGALALNSIFFTILYTCYPQTPEHPSRKIGTESTDAPAPDVTASEAKAAASDKRRSQLATIENDGEMERKKRSAAFYKKIIVILMMLFGHVSYGLELVIGQFLVTFCYTSALKMNKSEGAEITSLFWGTFTFWRLTTIFYIEYIGHEYNLLSSIVVIMIGNTVLVPFGESCATCLYVGVAIIGLGASSMWPSMFGYMEDHFHVSSRIASAVIVSATVGDFVFPYIITFFVDSNPRVFLWAVLACSSTLALVFSLMMIIMRTKLREGKESRKLNR